MAALGASRLLRAQRAQLEPTVPLGPAAQAPAVVPGPDDDPQRWQRWRELLAQAARAGGRARLISVPAPPRPAAAVFTLAPQQPAALWQAPAGPDAAELVLVGLGAARRLPATLDAAALQAAATAALGAVEVSAAPELVAARPRFLGGLPFAAGALDAPEWADFRDGALLLPRALYEPGAPGAGAVLSVFFDEGRADAGELLALWDALCALPGATPTAAGASHAPPPLGATDPFSPLSPLLHLSGADWARYLQPLLQALHERSIDKVVAARRSTVPLGGPLAPSAVAALLERLRAAHPLATILALRRGGSTFVAATPETLVRRRGRTLRTEALAGSLGRAGLSEAELGARLLQSDKDRAEHALVVEALRAALAPLCARLDIPAMPTVRLLPHLGHLCTPVRGELAADVPVLELALRLHPTPAVGGTPTAAALALIRAHEPAPRGLYAAPFGWFDDRGDGDFAVAIRSALLGPAAAHLYAGAGIVRGSTAAAEYEETALKLRALAEGLLGRTEVAP
ncbi:MAG: isochorismate synthase [Polyangia bacterium]